MSMEDIFESLKTFVMTEDDLNERTTIVPGKGWGFDWTGVKQTDDHKKKVGDAQRGKPRKKHSAETKKKMSNTRKGMLHSPEWNKKVGDAQRGIKRIPLLEEHKKKISEASMGKKKGPMSDETKRKLSEALKGKKHKCQNLSNT